VGILAIGSMVYPAMEAARLLEERGVSVYLGNARFVKPLDGALIRAMVGATGRIITVEENALAGGFGSGVLEWLEQEGLCDMEVHRMGIPDRFVEQGDRDALLRDLGLDAQGLVALVEDVLKGGRRSFPSIRSPG
jgi:1-deoxy-D-xylulose-5-phosphate synthase